MVMKLLELMGIWDPCTDSTKKVVGVTRLKISENLLKKPSNTDLDPDYMDYEKGLSEKEREAFRANNAAERVHSSDDLDSKGLMPIKARTIGLPEYVVWVREDYLELFDSPIGREMRQNRLGLELMWRDRVVTWADAAGLRELIRRMRAVLMDG